MRKQEGSYTAVRLKLPTFALLVLRRRAKRGRRTLADVLEALIWDDVLLDEAQAVAQESPSAARVFSAWFRDAVRRKP